MMQQPTTTNKLAGDALAAALRQDADRIRAAVSPELERRIDAAMARSHQSAATPVHREPGREPWIRPWLAGSLSGLAIAAAIVLLVGQPDEQMPAATPLPQSVAEQNVPEYITLLREQLPLRAETADLTAPLEEELENLRSDIEKARANLERDLRLAF